MAKAKESPARFVPGGGIGPASPLSTRVTLAPAAFSARPPANRQSWGLNRQSPSSRHAPALAVGIAICLASLGASPTTGPQSKPGSKPTPLTLLGRTIEQDQGAWVVEYRFRNSGEADTVLNSGEIAAKVEGWVSNSRVAAHALPRRSSIVLANAAGPSPGSGSGSRPRLLAEGTIIAAPEEIRRCKERLVVSVWPDSLGDCASCPSLASASSSASASLWNTHHDTSVVNLAPGASVRVRLRLEHQHVLYGDYDPLLGSRSVELTLGAAGAVRDVVPLDQERRRAQPKSGAIDIPEDRRDTERFFSAPDSLHLAAHIPGRQYCRIPELPVRYDTKMRLRFRYLIAAGTDGECRLRFSQVRETPVACPPLARGNFEQCLNVVGRWTKVERIIRTDPEATHVALEFGIVTDSYVGEMWIDDLSLEPLEASQTGP